MKCMHCGNILPENCGTCTSCGNVPFIPEGYRYDPENGLFYLTSDSPNPETGASTRLITWFHPSDGSYSHESFDMDAPVPEGFIPDSKEGFYRMTADNRNPETGKITRLITLFEAKTGRYTQELLPVNMEPQQVGTAQPAVVAAEAETRSEAVPEPQSPPDTEAKSESEPQSPTDTVAGPQSGLQPNSQLGPQSDNEPQPPSEPQSGPLPEQEIPQSFEGPLLQYEQVSDENADKPKKKKRHGGRIAALIILVLLLGLAGAGYYYGYYGKLVNLYNASKIENVTTPPNGADVPVFKPVDSDELPQEKLVTVPGEDMVVEEFDPAELEEPENESPPIIPMNYYPELPAVNSFSSRAMQDESFIYYLPPGDTNGLSDLMRVPIGSTKPEYIPNCFPQTASVYSFTLFESDIIACVKRPDTPVYGYYRVPKNGGEAQFLFEQSSPSLLNRHDGKLFMLFTAEQRFGVFDIKNDIQPAFVDLRTDSIGVPVYMPEFSVMNGYLYYGLSYDDGARTEYMRRSLYTGETVTVLGFETPGEPWIDNPVWDNAGTVYYGQFNRETGAYSVKSCKSGGAPESMLSFSVSDGTAPLISAFGSSGIIVASGQNSMREYRFDNLSAYDEISSPNGRAYAVTKSYIVAEKGIFTIAESEWLILEAPDDVAAAAQPNEEAQPDGEAQPDAI